MKTFEKGDIVFNEYGQRFVYVAESDGDHIVRPTVESDEDEHWEGNPVTLRKIFASAPREMYDKNIEALDARIMELDKQKRALEEEICKPKFDETERKKRIMVNAALERIDDFLAGKFTHIVYGDYTIKIETFDEALMYKDNEYSRVPDQCRLLSLYGKSNGDLAWKLSHWSDGSGSSNHVYPCFSLEDAQSVASKLIEAKYALWRKDPKANSVHSVFQDAVRLGFDIPDDVAKAIKESQINGARDWRDTKKKEYLEAEDELHNALNQTVVEFQKGKQ